MPNGIAIFRWEPPYGNLDCGLPQSSSLRPLKFVVCAADLYMLTSCHNVRLHSFADDTQMYKHTRIGDVQQAKQDVTATIAEVNSWSQSGGMILNAVKSEVIWIGTRQQLAKLSQADKMLHLPDGGRVICTVHCP